PSAPLRSPLLACTKTGGYGAYLNELVLHVAQAMPTDWLLMGAAPGAVVTLTTGAHAHEPTLEIRASAITFDPAYWRKDARKDD
ncbi:MAG: hypothetical protein ACHREM_31530, partial [Polyangiales bacterium]